MKGYVGVTDNEWFAFLSQQPGIDEVNFRQLHATGHFRALKEGTALLKQIMNGGHVLNCESSFM